MGAKPQNMGSKLYDISVDELQMYHHSMNRLDSSYVHASNLSLLLFVESLCQINSRLGRKATASQLCHSAHCWEGTLSKRRYDEHEVD